MSLKVNSMSKNVCLQKNCTKKNSNNINFGAEGTFPKKTVSEAKIDKVIADCEKKGAVPDMLLAIKNWIKDGAPTSAKVVAKVEAGTSVEPHMIKTVKRLLKK